MGQIRLDELNPGRTLLQGLNFLSVDFPSTRRNIDLRNNVLFCANAGASILF